MIEPDDFGMPGVRTFAHIGDPTPAGNHSGFWSRWFRLVTEDRPVLRPRTVEDPSDPTATHEFDSAGGVRIGCRLVLPPADTPVRAAIVVVHGSTPAPLADADRDWRKHAERGIAALEVRVRGFAGSQRETGDLTQPDQLGAGWGGRGFDAETDEEWIVPHAVADVVNACRVMRNWMLGRDSEGIDHPVQPSAHPKLFLFGESLGGGLAVIAAAQLTGKLPGDQVVDRLAVCLPSLGDMGWRLTNHPAGFGSDIERVLTHHAARRDELVERLRLCDAVIHATRVRRPALVKMAERDDVVPAPTQAAIFNALDADPGRKWRFVVPYGHTEGGIANARRHALFDRALLDFFDPERRPIHAMIDWEPLMSGGERTPSGEMPSLVDNPPADSSLFGADGADASADEKRLIEAYRTIGRTLDALPYTDEFERVCTIAGTESRRDTLHRLQRLRKAGKLPRLGRAPDKPPRIDPDHEALLTEMVIERAGTLGQRDRLPYTPDFERIVESYNTKTGGSVSAHDLWRLIARLAK